MYGERQRKANLKDKARAMRDGRLLGAYAAVWRRVVLGAHAIAAGAVLSHAATSGAAVYVAGPGDYRRVVPLLKPGDELALKAGIYQQGLSLKGIHGTPDHPITIAGPMREGIAVLAGRPGANTISLADASYITLRDLWLDGRHLPVDAVKAERGNRGVHHVTLERLTIVNHGVTQHIVGISTKCPAWGWVIRDNLIVGTGTGLYLGDSDGSAPFFAGVIEGNVIVDSIGYNLQIKHQRERLPVASAPEEPGVTIIRDNVFAKTRNASAEGLARPNVLVGHFPLQGPGKDDRYVISGNAFFENPTEALFQGEGNFQLEHNLFFTSSGDAIVVQPHHDVPRQVTVVGNFVAAAGRGIRVTGGDPGSMQDVVHNEVYAADPIRGGRHRENVTGSYVEAGAALARARHSGELFGGASTTALARRACALTYAGVPDTGSSEVPKTARHPACEFMRSVEMATSHR